MFEDHLHDWKIIPPFSMGKQLGKNFKFHNNIDISNDIFSKFLSFDQEIFKMGKFLKWINNFTSKSTSPSIIFSEFIWFNSNIRIVSKPVHFFSDKNLELYCPIVQ